MQLHANLSRVCVAWIALALLCHAVAHAQTQPADRFKPQRDALLAGVDGIAAPGLPGPLVIFGDDAFALIVGTSDRAPAPVVAASSLGKGRIIAFGHNGYLSREALDVAQTARLFQNIVQTHTSQNPVRIIAHESDSTFADIARQANATLKVIGQLDDRSLIDVDVFILNAGSIRRQDVTRIERFVRAGGTFVTGVPAWGWLQLNKNRTLDRDFPANQLLTKAGVLFVDGTMDVPQNRTFPTRTDLPTLLNGSDALGALLAQQAGELRLTRLQSSQAVRQLTRFAASVPADDVILLPKLVRAVTEHPDLQLPTEKSPLSDEQGLARVALTMQMRRLATTPVDQMPAHPSAEHFPGAVDDRAPRVTRTRTIDTSIPDWHSTGLYSPPGKVVKITVTSDAIGRGLQVRIGCHSDRLWHLATWKRPPEIDRTFTIDRENLSVASPFGGLIYIVVPVRAQAAKLDITIADAVEAPYFVLGQTSNDDWKAIQRHHAAPWAELATGKVIITVPSDRIRSLDDAEALMQFWDRVADACADLATIPRERKRPERYVTDVQISAGYMHAGYPIMTQLDAAERFVNLELLSTKGDWGMFHEIGHNHQHPDWTFDGTGEVTVNLFTLYILETVVPGAAVHDAIKPESIRKHIEKRQSQNKDFEKWKSDPFLALTMYVQLQQAFGWDTYKKVFDEYRNLPADQRPKNDQEKRDQWMVRFSRAVGKNLGPFFEFWGVPTTQQARDSIKHLPVWMPD
jgi:hypothetical protein